MDQKKYYKYFIKAKDGKLTPRTEVELIGHITTKEIKPDAEIYYTDFNKWVKLKELAVYKNKSQYTNIVTNSTY